MPDDSAKPFKKLLVANRSEIATRVFRAANELHLRTVAIYTQEDRFSNHRFKADEAYQLDASKGPVGAYLDIDGIVTLAAEKGVDAIHPGYGFLSERADFARACAEAGITFIGPNPEVLEKMGDKMAARTAAIEAGVPVLPGTEDPISDHAEALRVGKEIGFPLIIKAAYGGGGRGMRVVQKPEDFENALSEAQKEAKNAFDNDAVFIEKFIGRAKHIEIQIVGDRHGNIIHLFERDCSVQRRHQKVIEIATSVGLPEATRQGLYDAAIKLGQSIGYDCAGTVEFLVDADSGEWFFIEMNPRIQVEHTVTEEVTNIDIVRSQILICSGMALDDPEMEVPPQEEIHPQGFAVQARITTEDPENNFTPDIGKIITYRTAAGFGVRLDGGLGTTGTTVTPYYDSMLVKVTAHARSFDHALDRLKRALREFRIRGVKTNIPFLLNVIDNEKFRAGEATTRLIDTTPDLFKFKKRKDRATRLLSYIGDVIVNGNPNAKNQKPKDILLPSLPVPYDHRTAPAAGSRNKLRELGPEKFCQWILDQKALLLTDTTFRDAHQSLLATRVRSFDMLEIADAVAHRAPQLFSLEMWGGATFDTAMRFLKEDPWMRLEQLRERIPNLCFQMLFRGSNAVGYSNYPDSVVTGFVKHAYERGMDIFRIFDSLNYVPNMVAAMEAVRETDYGICEAAICYTGDILDPSREKYSLQYYVDLAKELESLGAHMLAIKDMAGLCRPPAAFRLVDVLKQEVGLPLHFHTHDTSGLNASSILKAAEAGVDIVDDALSALSGSTSQPNLNSVVAALEHTERETGLDRATLDEFSDYWEHVRTFYFPFDTSPPHGSAEVYLHEMPGGQFTNLKEQANAMGLGHRWPEIARTYAAVNDLFGDIVKVTPSSKVVGDMTMFLVTQGIHPEDVLNLPKGTNFPESVVDMLAGGLGQPVGGWPKELQDLVVTDREIVNVRPGEVADPIELSDVRKELAATLGREPSEHELWSHLMYPAVFSEYTDFRRKFSDVSVLPTPAYFYGLTEREEITVHIEAGKTLFIKLIHIGPPDDEGICTIIFELNGVPRHVAIHDRHIAPTKQKHPKADPADENQVGAPMPGLIASVAVSKGHKVEEGDPLLTLEAMKMFTTVTAPKAGLIESIAIEVGANVESKDLLVTIA